MNILQLQGAIEVGLIFSIVAIGVYLSFRVLQFPDLTVDGTFPLGAAVCAALITQGLNAFVCLLIAAGAGAIFGWLTAQLANRMRILNLLAGIITMSGLYSINIRVMGNKPNISLLGENTIFSSLQQILPSNLPTGLLLLLGIVALVATMVILFLNSQLGLALRTVGCNPQYARTQGIDDMKAISIGLALSNALVALAGGVFAQLFGFADASLGVGTIVVGLAAVIIGESLLNIKSMFAAIMACIVGAITYRLIIAFALNFGHLNLQAADLNLITAILVTLAMSAAKLQKLSRVKI